MKKSLAIVLCLALMTSVLSIVPALAAQGLAFTALGIKNGETFLPGYTIELKDIRVKGEEIAFEKGYTSSDDGIETRMNIYN